MKITLLDDLHRPINALDCDLEVILTQAEQMGGDIFDCAVSLLEEFIDYRLLDAAIPIAKKYLRRFIALGDLKDPLIINVIKDKKKDNVVSVRRGDEVVDISTTSFEEVVTFPNKQYEERYNRLVGLDQLKNLIKKEAAVLLAPELLIRWSKHHHGSELSVLRAFSDRYPFIIFEGDVGTGKTEFAETFGASISTSINKKVSLVRMSMKSRGSGIVGEMSKLISKAFLDVKAIADKTKSPVILLLDEADSLAQSREESQMHHEDRAGVNALIQGIDHIRDTNYPILVIFCTNRSQALDPAIKRRAAIIHAFKRPNEEQRLLVFRTYFSELNLKEVQLMELAQLSGESKDRPYGHTYSDLITRVIPHAVFEAFPDSKLTFDIIKSSVTQLRPTPPFKEGP